ncbi:MAG: CopG family transcriptional regulator [Euryarchaeota archaeon]|nr:CopG family transcriptional regulator [Euryarchaeota archaeon]
MASDDKAKRKRVQVAFTMSQWKLIENFRGEFGEGDADIVRNIILAWLAEKSFISTVAKNKINNGSENHNGR